jgi:hypothetical protein
MIKPIHLLPLFFLSVATVAQPDTTSAESSDTLWFRPGTVHLQPVAVFGYGGMTADEISAFRRMLMRINKLYPYALEAMQLMREADAELASLDRKKDQRQYRKATERDLREEYTEILKNLTVGESEVLIKMIERATGMSLFDIIKKYKDGVAAAWWQSVAKLAGLDLKEGYDPNKWKIMEFILKAVESDQTLPTK